MTDRRHTPGSLAEELDAILAGKIAPGDDPLEQTAARLADAPAPKLRATAFERIQAQVLEANAAAAPSADAGFRLPRVASVAGGLFFVALLLLGGGFFLSTIVDDDEAEPSPTVTATITPSTTPTSTVTETVPQPTPTINIRVPVVTDVPTQTSLPTLTPSLTSTPSPTSTLTPSPLPTETALPVNVVVEGPVQSITGSVVTVYDYDINFEPDAPLLSALQVGDVVRIQAAGDTTDITTAAAVEVTVENVEVDVSATGAVFRNDSDCGNPPPDWAPAVGWRNRCQGGGNSGNAPGNSGNAPGNSGDAPGNSGDAPGRQGDDDNGRGGRGDDNPGRGGGRGNQGGDDDD